jgi:hypothetical protein
MASRRYAKRGSQGPEDNEEWRDANFQDRGWSYRLPALFRSPAGLRQRDYSTSANHDDLQGITDPRGPVGMTVTRKRGPRCSQPPLGGLTK